ncbi:ABC transporter ATP-binding protein [Clostridium frigidicarnis]|uniref:ATP-binding cassette, subfamily B n=1 Tax=Clostridium frigidicarnis TaxID=84698 RepID=A0A1I0W7E1_9CLOT|nr:ABC transporter ATP-binding protein [Clostridium frigidicarnis]SFA83953.1 ATP-binding cassette, subfamily B [Clostridium frigidicarnis]
MNFIREYMNKYWKSFGFALCFLTLETLCDLLQPTIMSRIIDIGVKNKDINYVVNMGLIMLLITGLGAVFALNRSILASKVSQHFGADLREGLFKKINTFSFENIDKFNRASLITRVTNDVNQVQVFINGLMRIFVKAPLLCIGSIIMAVRLNPSMSLVIIGIMPIIIAIMTINMKKGYPHFRKVQNSLDKVNSIIREYLSGIRVVKAFNKFDYEKDKFDIYNNELLNSSTKAMRVMCFFNPAITLVVNIGIIIVIWIGGIRVSNGNMQVGQIVAFINYMGQILSSLILISYILNTFVRVKASSERIQKVFDEKNNISQDNSLEFNNDEKNMFIEFNDVCFSYIKEVKDYNIKNINFKLSSGETIGIIGSTGSGKTTIVNLIPRFYDVDCGSIKIGENNIKDINLKYLRNKISIVPQKNILFTGTIMDNIKWGKENATLEEVERVAKIADAHNFICGFKDGYNTMIGQGGVNVSGGQKQRISIARAIIKNPEILILDDCTSAVDANTELNIKNGLKEQLNNSICIIIAQRITSVMDADKIIVLDNGEIVGEGNHKELMQNCSVYKDIFISQMGRTGDDKR